MYAGRQFESAVCERCGGRISPKEALRAHVMRHNARDIEMRKKWLEPLRATLRAMRNK